MVSSVEPTKSVNKIVIVLELDIRSPEGAPRAEANADAASRDRRVHAVGRERL